MSMFLVLRVSHHDDYTWPLCLLTNADEAGKIATWLGQQGHDPLEDFEVVELSVFDSLEEYKKGVHFE